jgi:glucokinase
VVSGLGIVAIYQFLRDRKFAAESPDIAQIVRTWEQEAGQEEKSVDPGAAIGAAALQGSDRLCEQTLQLFIDAYGAEAGNLALKLLPYGGLYIAGGIAPKILPLIQNSDFLLNFTQKGRMRRLLEEIPVYIILNSQVGLIGAALCAARL